MCTNKQKYKFLFLLYFFGFIIGCGSYITQDELVGVFILQYPYGTEKLILKKDGSYDQSFLMNGENNPRTNKGKWKIEKKKPSVILIDAMLVDNFYGKPRQFYWEVDPGQSWLQIKKKFGKTFLILNREQGFVFKKK